MSDPWYSLDVPSDLRDVSAIRVSAVGRWDFFWGVDSSRRVCLLLHFSASLALPKWPELRGVEVLVDTTDGGKTRRLVVRLSEPDLRDVFAELCRDVVERSEGVTSPELAIAAVCGRLWRWHFLLRGGRGRLSIQQQAGLWAELRFLEYAGERIGYPGAVAAWAGPLHAIHDFEFERLTVEVKAAFGTRTTSVKISSEFQLVAQDSRALFLWIYRVAARDSQNATSASLDQLIASITTSLEVNTLSLERFQQLFAAAGYDSHSGYPQQFGFIVEPRSLRVDDGFPAIRPKDLPAGVRTVQYSIGLDVLLALPDATVTLTDYLDWQKELP